MEFSVKKITETNVQSDEGESTKYTTMAVNSEDEVEVSIKESGSCSYNVGDKLELKKVQSQTTLVPIKEPKKRGRPRKEPAPGE